eukprot:SAG22_NODE_243_length_14055_cov_3.073015_1_plen_167_part_00
MRDLQLIALHAPRPPPAGALPVAHWAGQSPASLTSRAMADSASEAGARGPAAAAPCCSSPPRSSSRTPPAGSPPVSPPDAASTSESDRDDATTSASAAITGTSDAGTAVDLSLAFEDQEVSDDAQCPICLTFLCDPLTLQCSHSFCRVCVMQSTRLSPDGRSCPLW